jgi:hypothetical protein
VLSVTQQSLGGSCKRVTTRRVIWNELTLLSTFCLQRLIVDASCLVKHWIHNWKSMMIQMTMTVSFSRTNWSISSLSLRLSIPSSIIFRLESSLTLPIDHVENILTIYLSFQPPLSVFQKGCKLRLQAVHNIQPTTTYIEVLEAEKENNVALWVTLRNAAHSRKHAGIR